jgi:hypothetical protein
MNDNKKSNTNYKSFLKKWFFPPTFSILFYPVYPLLWFWLIHEMDRNLDNFINYSINFVVIYSILYLADTNDGRFARFHYYLEATEKWKARSIVGLIFILWLILISFTHSNFPVVKI